MFLEQGIRKNDLIPAGEPVPAILICWGGSCKENVVKRLKQGVTAPKGRYMKFALANFI
jgi:hypothetical protein